MIKWIHLKNFKALKDTKIEFTQPFTAIIGPNNTGKSTILNALNVLRGLAATPLSQVLNNLNYFSFLRTAGSEGDVELALQLEYAHSAEDTGCYEYAISLNSPQLSGWIRVQNESLTKISANGEKLELLKRKSSESAWVYLNEQSNKKEEWQGDQGVQGIFQLQDRVRHKSIIQFRTLLGSAWIFDLQPTAMKNFSQISSFAVLAENGGNIAAVLDRFRGEEPEAFDKLEHDLRRVIPEIKSIILKTLDGGNKYLAFREKFSSEPISAFHASDGLLRTIAMLTAIHDSNGPLLLGIEEPENGIHPRRLELIVESLRDYSQTKSHYLQRQVVITTHSPYVLDWLKPEELLITSRGSNGICVRRLDPSIDIKALLEDSSLGELWHRGSLGGVPTP